MLSSPRCVARGCLQSESPSPVEEDWGGAANKPRSDHIHMHCKYALPRQPQKSPPSAGFFYSALPMGEGIVGWVSAKRVTQHSGHWRWVKAYGLTQPTMPPFMTVRRKPYRLCRLAVQLRSVFGDAPCTELCVYCRVLPNRLSRVRPHPNPSPKGRGVGVRAEIKSFRKKGGLPRCRSLRTSSCGAGNFRNYRFNSLTKRGISQNPTVNALQVPVEAS